MNGKEYRCALHHRGQDPEETKRWKKQRARSWWDERLSRANYQRKLSDHTCSNKQLVEETITSQTGDTWPHRIKNVRRDAVPSETGKSPPSRNRPDVLNKRVDYANWFMCLSTNAATIFGRPEVMAGRGKERGRTAKCAASVYETWPWQWQYRP